MLDPASAPAADAGVVPELNAFEMYLLIMAGLTGLTVGTIGLASSYQSVSAAAARWDFAYPWMLPVGIDVAIPTFSIAYLLLVRLNMPCAWVRWVPWLLTGATVTLNVAAAHSLTARLAHGTMPLLWVALSEVAAHVYRVRIGQATGTRMERIRRSRWILAPWPTLRLWRRMVLWETTSYTDALTREENRLMARAALRRAHGRRWHFTAPLEDRVKLRMGTLTAADVTAPAKQQPAPKPTSKPAAPPAPAKSRTPRAPSKTGKEPKPGPRSPQELLTAARKTTADWPDARLTADHIRAELHVSAANARMLRDALKDDRRSGRIHLVADPAAADVNDPNGVAS
jgi:hypothetical protein